MSRFNIQSLDLNLLSVFVILWDTRSVSRTSERLMLTQPAVSHALKRLRDRLGDALFVPTRQGLVPTARAAELINPVREALGQIERALKKVPSFTPAEGYREFRIATRELIEFWMLPALLEVIGREAPGVVIRSVPVPEPHSAQALLEAGDIDIIVDGRPLSGTGVRCEPLSEVNFVTLIWKREKLRNGKFPLSLYLKRPHVIFRWFDPTGSAVDHALAAKGYKRKVGAIVQTFLAMPAVAARTGYVCNVPYQVGERFAEVFDLSVHRPPVDLPRSTLFHAWHVRFESDPALAWLLRRMREVMAPKVRPQMDSPKRR
jgi:DNA-binding transcriptional LysR family regulator